ncbi:MAG: hypothetical protein R2764_01640 [Bacteroidales bacterium]
MKKITFILLLALLSFFPHICLQAGLPQSVQDSTNLKVIKPIDLIDINREIEKIEKSFTKIENLLKPDPKFLKLDSSFRDYKQFLEKEANDLKSYNPYNLSKYFLESTYRLWGGFKFKLTAWQTLTNSQLIEIQDNIEELNRIDKVWVLTLEATIQTGEPDELKNRIRAIIKRSNNYLDEFQNQKRRVLLLEDGIAEMSTLCDYIIARVSELQQNKRDSLFIASVKPMWEVTIDKSDYLPVLSRLNKSKHENAKTVKNYFQTQSITSFLVFSFFIVLLFIVLRYRYLKMNFDDSIPGHKLIIRIFQGFPVLTVISILLVLFHILHPYYPLFLNNLLTLFLLINMRYILSNFIDKEVRFFIFKLVMLLIVNDLEIVMWYFGNVARYYILLETILGMVLMMGYFKPAYLKKFKTSHYTKKAMLVLSLFVFSFYFVAFVSNFLGNLNLAVLFIKVGIHVSTTTIILYGIYLITLSIIKASASIGRSGKGRIPSEYWDTIERRAVKISGFLAVYYWFFTFAVAFEVSSVIYDSIADFLAKERTIEPYNLPLVVFLL